jgi:hypothetical protein
VKYDVASSFFGFPIRTETDSIYSPCPGIFDGQVYFVVLDCKGVANAYGKYRFLFERITNGVDGLVDSATELP